jgi:hypothetical protein
VLHIYEYIYMIYIFTYIHKYHCVPLKRHNTHTTQHNTTQHKHQIKMSPPHLEQRTRRLLLPVNSRKMQGTAALGVGGGGVCVVYWDVCV